MMLRSEIRFLSIRVPPVFKREAHCRYAVLAYLGYNQDLQRGVLLLLQQVSRAAPGINT